MPIVVPVRFRYAAIDLWFDPLGFPVHKGDHLIVETERGLEIGLAVDEAFNVNEETLRAPLKPVVRIATQEDLDYADELSQKAPEALAIFKETVEEMALDMKPVACEYLFDGEKIVCYFAADDRIDFRDLVKELAAQYKMRVDMRQIGVRDEARLIGGFGHCGQELCCKRFGREFDPVSIRMAKEQDLPLNPSKISGACGRLMCCLRYEFIAYKDFKSRAPKFGALIETPLGTAKLVSFDTPREILTLRLENGKQFNVPLKSMCCSKSSEGAHSSCGSSCSCSCSATQKSLELLELSDELGEDGQEQHRQYQRPDMVSREALDQLDDQVLQLLLSQLDTEKALQDLHEKEEQYRQDIKRRKSSQAAYLAQDSHVQDSRRSKPKQGFEKPSYEQDSKRSKGISQEEKAIRPRRTKRVSTLLQDTVLEDERSRRRRSVKPQSRPIHEETHTAPSPQAKKRRRPGDGGGLEPSLARQSRKKTEALKTVDATGAQAKQKSRARRRHRTQEQS